jgi:hypothetical protein
MTIEKLKELAKEFDSLQREDARNKSLVNEVKCDEIRDKMDLLWHNLTNKEDATMRDYFVELQNNWTPLETYNDAVRVLEEWPQPSSNNVTPIEVQEARKAHWIKIRAEAFAKT